MKTVELKQLDPVLLQVTRDGLLDEQYYDNIWAERRRETLRMAGRQLIEKIKDTPALMLDGVWFVIDHLDSQK